MPKSITDFDFPRHPAGDEPITHRSVVFYKLFETVVEGMADELEGDDQQALELQAIADLVVNYCQRRYKRESLMTALNSVADEMWYFNDGYKPPIVDADANDTRFEIMGCKYTCYCNKCVSWNADIRGHCGLPSVPTFTRLSDESSEMKCSGYIAK